MKKNEKMIADCGGEQPIGLNKCPNGITELVFIIDRSGSMSGLEADTIGGFNSTIESQREKGGKVYVSTVLFDHESFVLHDRVNIEKVEKMTRRDYQVRGSTALLDAVGDTMKKIELIHRYICPTDVPEHTIFVITTDGMENASCRYTQKMIKTRITQAQKERGWEFIFLGANIDVAQTADDLGIRRDRATNYKYDPKGVDASYRTMNKAIANVRDCNDDFDLGDIMDEEEKSK